MTPSFLAKLDKFRGCGSSLFFLAGIQKTRSFALKTWACRREHHTTPGRHHRSISTSVTPILTIIYLLSVNGRALQHKRGYESTIHRRLGVRGKKSFARSHRFATRAASYRDAGRSPPQIDVQSTPTLSDACPIIAIALFMRAPRAVWATPKLRHDRTTYIHLLLQNTVVHEPMCASVCGE